MYGIGKAGNALRVLRYASQFVTLLAAPSPSSRQLLCPSCHFVHFVLRSAPLHHVRSPTICYKAWHPFALHNSYIKRECTYLSAKLTLQYSLGSIPLHYVLHSLQSHSVHPLPIILLALRTTACVSGLH